ncbi:MAG: hypothetical protein IPK60_08015 [Sandaracinaceae bacterium]|nr:hypothetical protein [Sandaracinaceae bacterium]
MIRPIQRRWIGAFFLPLLGMAAACSEDPPSLIVHVATSLVPGAEFDRVETDIVGNEPVTSGVIALRHVEATASFGEPYAQGKPVADFNEVAPGIVTVRVRLVRPDGRRLLERRVRVTLQQSKAAFVLVVHMSRECLDVTCPNAGGDSALSECLAGQCVDPRCNPPATDFCPPSIFCNTVAECAPTAPCASSLCVDGICEASANDGACTASEWCDPTAGCMPLQMLDAGATDASLLDGGMDSSHDAELDAMEVIDSAATDAFVTDAGPVCGTICVSDWDPCRFDYWDCTDGTPVCAGRMQRSIGAHCAPGAICSEFGSCDPCEEALDCLVDGCVPGRTSCSRGYSDCIPNGMPPLPEGTECASGSVCSAAGACWPIAGTVPCDIGCDHGSYDYASGSPVCVLDGSPSAPGLSCGANQVCDGTGTCVDCIFGASCTAGCALGYTTCGAGPMCMPSGGGNAPAGTSCGSGRVCNSAGVCADCLARAVCEPALECQIKLVDCSRGPQCLLASNRPAGTPCSGGICTGNGACAQPITATTIHNDGTHACAVMTDGSLVCWGDNSSGELGVGDGSFPYATKYTVAGLANVVEVATTEQRTCARTMSGEVYCWGRNFVGEIGNGTTTPSSTPVHVTLPSPAISISVTQGNTCAVLNTGSVRCWGIGYAGVIGNGATMDALVPTPVTGLTDALRVYLSPELACALRTNGHVSCWGAGGVGNGTSASTTPVEVSGLDQVIDVSLTPDFSGACAVRTGGEVWCWGNSASEVALPFADAVDIELSSSFNCIRRSSGSVWCAGNNYNGQLGRGPIMAEPANPYGPVTGLGAVTQISQRGCARVSTSTWYCWGNNYNGQLGNGTSGDSYNVPVLVEAP